MKAFGFLIALLMITLTASACDEPFPVPATPAAVSDIVYARPFSLEQGYSYDWRQERPTVKAGVLVVLKVDPCLVYPRNSAEPVLYVDNQTAQRLNYGHESGHVIAIIPGPIELSRAPMWFGSPELPERVNAEMIRRQRVLAEEADIKPFPADKLRNVTASALDVSDLSALLRDYASDLVLEYSPQEKDLAETWRLLSVRPIP